MSESAKAVFLSYASQDADAAGRICAALRAGGIEVWFDQSELRGGDVWDASIRRQIKACALFIAVLSRNTHARDEGYFRLEWKLAVDRSHLMAASKPFLLPVAIDDLADDGENVPDRFREVQWMRLPGGPVPREFVERVRRLLSGEPATGRSAAAGPESQARTRRWTWLHLAAAFVAATVLVSVVGYYLTLPTEPHRASAPSVLPPETEPAAHPGR